MVCVAKKYDLVAPCLIACFNRKTKMMRGFLGAKILIPAREGGTVYYTCTKN